MAEERAEVVQKMEIGSKVKGTVVNVEPQQALVDIGYESDAILPISEVSSLHIQQVSDALQVGDVIEVQIIRKNEEEPVVVSKKQVDQAKAWVELQKKFDKDEAITTQIADVVKGGLVVDVGVRGFIPASLVELEFVEDFSEYKGKEVTVKVIEINPERNKCILSRKAILEEAAQKQKKETLNQIEAGQVIAGKVQRITDFGAFVDVGGVDGLVHVSELAWHRVGHPSEVLKEGDQVQVKVLKVDRENERISLSLKETQEGPWEKVQKEVSEGDILTGQVKRLVSFGAFVEVYPGVEGLVHISQISQNHIETPQEVLAENQTVQVKVLSMLPEQQRISLSIKEAAPEKKEAKQQEKPKPVQSSNDNQDSGFNVTLGDVYPELRNFK